MAKPTREWRQVLKSVGNALIAIGAFDIVLMVSAIASGRAYASGLNVFALAAGQLLRSGGLKTARVVTLFSGLYFAGGVAAVIALVLVIPFDLLRLIVRLSPGVAALRLVALLGMIAGGLWTYRKLTSEPMRLAMEEQRVSFPTRYRAGGMFIGVAIVAFVGLLFGAMSRSEAAKRAIVEAERQVGPSYSFFVESLATTTSRQERRGKARVVAYNSDTAKTVLVKWVDLR